MLIEDQRDISFKQKSKKPLVQKGALSLRNLAKLYGSVVAVDDISAEIPKGSYCCILGPSGCGKTTTLRMMAGHETVSEGDIFIDGAATKDLTPSQRPTSMMFQSYALFPHLNVLDNVAFSMRMKGQSKAYRHEKAREILEIVEMGAFAKQKPNELSGGQQQRIALARALATRPSILALDEPLSALDPFLRVRVRGELKALQRQLGITFLHVTHSQEEALALADLVMVMNKGKIEQFGKPQEVFHTPSSLFVARFLGVHNIVPLEIDDLEKGEVTLRVKNGGTCTMSQADLEQSFQPLPADKLGKGQQFNAIIPVEKCSFSLAEKSSPMRFFNMQRTASASVVVDSIEYAGTSLVLRCRLRNTGTGDSLVINVPTDKLQNEEVKVGSVGIMTWPVSSMLMRFVDGESEV